MPDPDAMRQVATDAVGNTDVKLWSVVSMVLGGGIMKAIQKLRGDTIVQELQRQGDETRMTMNAVGETTHRKLDALTMAVAHLQGQVDGSRR